MNPSSEEPAGFALVTMKRAKQFRPKGAPTRQEQKAQSDRWRGSAHQRGYNSRWGKARLTFLSAHSLCIGCEAMKRTVAAEIVDHVDPHHGDPDKFWDTSMWQPCCKWHHDSVKQKLEWMYANGQATLDDLWLNSDLALRIANRMVCEEA